MTETILGLHSVLNHMIPPFLTLNHSIKYFDRQKLEHLRRIASRTDIVLVSHTFKRSEYIYMERERKRELLSMALDSDKKGKQQEGTL